MRLGSAMFPPMNGETVEKHHLAPQRQRTAQAVAGREGSRVCGTADLRRARAEERAGSHGAGAPPPDGAAHTSSGPMHVSLMSDKSTSLPQTGWREILRQMQLPRFEDLAASPDAPLDLLALALAAALGPVDAAGAVATLDNLGAEVGRALDHD